MVWWRGPQQACARLLHWRESVVLVFALISSRGRLVFWLGHTFIGEVWDPVEGVQLREGDPGTGLSLEGTLEQASNLLDGPLLHEEWEAGCRPGLEDVGSNIQRQQARHPLAGQSRLMQLVAEGGCGVHAKETHPTAHCVLHALQRKLCCSIHTVCRLQWFFIGCLLDLVEHRGHEAGRRNHGTERRILDSILAV